VKPTRAERISNALASAFVVLCVGVGAVGLTRWLDAQRHGLDADHAMRSRAENAASLIQNTIPESIEAGSIHLVLGGTTNTYGALTGGRIAASRTPDPTLVPADESSFSRELLRRHAEFSAYLERGQPIPADRLIARSEIEGTPVIIGYAPIVRDNAYLGLLRLADRTPSPDPTIPTHRLLLALALAFILALFIPRSKLRRALLGLAAAAPLVLLFALSPLTHIPGILPILSPLLAFAAASLAGPGLASVVIGLKEQPKTYLYILPAIIGMVVLVFIPFLMGVTLAFFSEGQFVGLSNFEEILVPPETATTTFYSTTAFTVLWTVANVALHVLIGVLLALVLNRPNLRFKGLYRVLLVIPWAVPSYITALIWKSLFNTQFGAINGLLDVFGLEPVKWLGPGSSLLSNFLAALTTNTWLGFPFMMVVTLGALQSIPKELYEAADIDGATRLQKFRMVTLPLLKPALIPAIILGVIWTFNMFNVIYLVTGGAPDNQTNILVTEAFFAFKVLDRFGLAAAYSLLIFVMLLLYGWMQNRITRATEGAFE
jgi:arabinogalactan oligomer/maltooligosaccharide transport system permease protein